MDLKNWKILTGFAVFGFIIALIAGIITGVGFGRIILRSIISGVIFGALGYILLLIIKSRLPEMYSLIIPESGESEVPSGVDIVISDDTEGEQVYSADPGKSADDFVEEIEETGDLTNTSASVEAEELDAVEELSGTGDDEPDDGENLPELDNMENTFDQKDLGSVDGLSDISKDSKTVELMGEYQDPENVARAVQTMMKKDEG